MPVVKAKKGMRSKRFKSNTQRSRIAPTRTRGICGAFISGLADLPSLQASVTGQKLPCYLKSDVIDTVNAYEEAQLSNQQTYLERRYDFVHQ